MATTCYFEETITDQGGKTDVLLEIGSSTAFSGCAIPSGTGEPSIYLRINDGQMIVMSRKTAQKFVEAVLSVGTYYNMV
jgi:hypothetical protein